jgi:hypothetical protein
METYRDASNDEMRSEYDVRSLNGLVRGKYAGRMQGTTKVIGLELDPDLAMAFPDAASVNAALRQYLKDHPPQPANPA